MNYSQLFIDKLLANWPPNMEFGLCYVGHKLIQFR